MLSAPVARPPKPHLPIGGQVELLRSRGLEIGDDVRAADYLRRVGYYRLSGYWKPFLAGPSGESDRFVPGASFAHVADLYIFDKRLRLTLLDALERIEVAFRAEVAHHMGAKNPLAHRRTALLRPDSADRHRAWLGEHDGEVRRSREVFVSHHREKYGGELPIWAAVELWSFGALSRFYAMMNGADQRAVAARFGVENERLAANWLRGMTFVRNVSAHHGRLWNRGSVGRLSPRGLGKTPAGFDPPLLPRGRSSDRLCAVLCATIFLVRQICPRSGWPSRLRDLLRRDFPDAPDRSLREMGFPPKWEESAFWRK